MNEPTISFDTTPHQPGDGRPPRRTTFAARLNTRSAALVVLGAVVVVGAAVAVLTMLGGDDRDSMPAKAPCVLDSAADQAPCFLAPGLVAQEFDLRSDGTADVLLRGPHDIRIEGTLAVTGADWTLSVYGGLGHVGDTELVSEDFSGEITSVGGAITSTVEVLVSDHPEIFEDWEQEAILSLAYSSEAPATDEQNSDDTSAGDTDDDDDDSALGVMGYAGARLIGFDTAAAAAVDTTTPTSGTGGLTGQVDISSSDGLSDVSHSGPLNADGSYELIADGTLHFSGNDLPVTGNYSSTSDWAISADAGGTSMADGSSITAGLLQLTSKIPAVSGSVTVQPIPGDPLKVKLTLDYKDGDDWTLTADGENTGTYSPPSLPNLTVNGSSFSGTVRSVAGEISWSVSGGMSLTYKGISVDGNFYVDAPGQWGVSVSGASGVLSGGGEKYTINDGSGSLDFNGGDLEGAFSLDVTGDNPLVLPDGWTSNAAVDLLFRKEAGSPTPEVSVGLSIGGERGDDSFAFSGSWNPAAYKLDATGTLGWNGTSYTLTGAYESAGWPADDGTVREEPFWSIEAEIDDAPIGGGVSIVAATLSLDSENPGFVGSAGLKFAANSPFVLDIELDYDDSDNWALTSQGSGVTSWSPPGMTGLTINPSEIYGSVISEDGEIDWALGIDEIEWKNPALGSTMTTDFSISDRCPLEENCPNAEGIFVGVTNGSLTFPSPVPAMTTEGAFLVDGSWARFEADLADFTWSYEGLSLKMSDSSMVLWHGPRTDQFDPDLDMPDLSSKNGGFGAEFCGNFAVKVPEVPTLATGGCASFTKAGSVFGQVALGGDIDSGESNGISIGNTSLDGWAFTSLSLPKGTTIGLNGIAVSLPKGVNNITGKVTMPGVVMKAIGQPAIDTPVNMLGTFGDRDFTLDGEIELNLGSQGFHIDDITVHIGKEGSSFSFFLGADGSLRVDGDRFPIETYIGVEVGGGSSEVVASFTAKGQANGQPLAYFDGDGLLPGGTFEPPTLTTVDGSNDKKTNTSVYTTGDFEDAVQATPLFPNSGFENGTGFNMIPEGDIEGADYGNFLVNGDFEDTNIVSNSSWEENGDGWGTTGSSISAARVADSPADADAGDYSVRVSSSSTPPSPYTNGYYDGIGNPVGAATYAISMWVKSGSTTASTNGYFTLSQTGTDSGCASQQSFNNTTTFTATTSWQYLTTNVVGNQCSSAMRLILNVSTANTSVLFDDVEVNVTMNTTTTRVPVTEVEMPVTMSTSDATVATYLDPARGGHTGSGYTEITTKTNSANVKMYSYEKPTPGYWAMDMWVRSSGATQTGTLMFIASNDSNSTVKSMNYSVTSTWTRFSFSMYFSATSYDKFVMKIEPNYGGPPIQLDDITMTQLPFPVTAATSPGNTTMTVGVDAPDDSSDSWAYDGTSWVELSHTGDANPGTFTRTTTTPVYQNATYTLTAWVRSKSGNPVAGDIKLNLVTSGGVLSPTTLTNFTATSEWQQVSRSVFLSGSYTAVKATFDVKTTNEVLAIDGITLTGNGVAQPVSTDDAWTASNAVQATWEYANYGHTGSGFLDLIGSTTAGYVYKDSGFVPTAGTTYTVSAWVRNTDAAPFTGKLWAKTVNSSGTVLEQGYTGFTVPASSGDWRLVTVNLPVTNVNAANLRVQIDTGTTNAHLHVDDIGILPIGLTQSDPWVPLVGSTAGSTLGTVIKADASAHDGANLLEFRATGSAGAVYNNMTVDPAVGETYTFSGWVRSPSGSTVSGSITLTSYSSTDMKTVVQSNPIAITANGTWQHVYVTLPITVDAAALRATIWLNTLGVALDVDGLAVDKMAPFRPAGPSGSVEHYVVVQDPDNAQDGSSYLKMLTFSNGGGVSLLRSSAPTKGESYTASAWVRSTTAGVKGQLLLWAQGGTASYLTKPFTTTTDWQLVQVELPITASNNTSLLVEVDVSAPGGSIMIDSVTLERDRWVMPDPWSTWTANANGTTSMTAMIDGAAYSGIGYLRFGTSNPAVAGGVYKNIGVAPLVGQRFTMTTWVKAPLGAPVEVELKSLGGAGTDTTVTQVVGTGGWQPVSLTLPINYSGHTNLQAWVRLLGGSGSVDIDDVIVQQLAWVPFQSSGTVTAKQIDDTDNAQSGTGYFQISKSASVNAGVYLDTPGSLANGSQQIATVFYRTPETTAVTGSVTVRATGSGTDDLIIVPFTAGATWQKLEIPLNISHTGQNNVRIELRVDQSNARLDVDSISLQEGPIGEVDGIDTPLSHPEQGYSYLKDNVFGIPGAHLWAMTAQIGIYNGAPGLGVGATMYFDPTKAPSVFDGTDWLKGDLVANISAGSPCFLFDFDSGSPDTGVAIEGGLFRTSQFQIAMAPLGCTVGPYTVPRGAHLSFSSMLGNASIDFAMEIGKDDEGEPTFYENLRLENLKLGGTTYNVVDLTIDITTSSSDVSFVGDFDLPFGSLDATYDMSVNADRLHLDGSVALTDWKVGGSNFDINTLEFDASTDIPFGANACANFSANASGDLKMAGRQYDFEGSIATSCGVLQVLHISYDYKKGKKTFAFNLDYDGDTHVLAGGVKFKFERKASWLYLGYRYRRHGKVNIELRYSVDFDKPSNASLYFGGSISMSGGSGSVACQFANPGDDYCKLVVKMNILGGYTYKNTW